MLIYLNKKQIFIKLIKMNIIKILGNLIIMVRCILLNLIIYNLILQELIHLF